MTYCEIENKILSGNTSYLLKWGNITTNSSSNFYLDLEKDETYQVLMMNNVNGSYISLDFEIPKAPYTITASDKIGGLRVKKIISKSDENTPAIIKKYVYGAVRSKKIKFHDYTETIRKSIENGESSESVLHIYSHNIGTPRENDVTYSNVKEFISNQEEETLGYTEYDFYNLQSEPTFPFDPIYPTDPINGSVKNIKKYNADNELVEQTKNEYYQTGIDVSHELPYGAYFYQVGNYTHACTDLGIDPDTGRYRYYYFPATYVVDPAPDPGSGGYTGWYCDPSLAPSQVQDMSISPRIKYETSTYRLAVLWNRLINTTNTKYLAQDSITTTTHYRYDNPTHHQVTQTETEIIEDGKTITKKIYYPDDVISTSSLGNVSLTSAQFNAIKKLQKPTQSNPDGQHQIALPVQTETIVNDNDVLSTSLNRTLYKDWGNGLVLPESVQTSKGTNTLEDRIAYHGYDAHGNLLEVSKANGTQIYYIWGYNKQYPIARLEGFGSSDVTTAVQGLMDVAMSASDLDNDNCRTATCKEQLLRDALEDLRDHSALANAMVTTYTYDPLIGVTSMTDPRGYTTYYEYDESNRLRRVRDADGNMLSENEYHYKGQ